MKIDQVLSLGVRLVGLITLLFAFVKLVHGFTSLFIALSMTEAAQDLMFAQRFVSFLGVVLPLALGVIGYYLISSADRVANKMILSNPFEHDNLICSKNVFHCALKLLGLGLVIYSLSPITEGLTGLFYIQSLRSEIYIPADQLVKSVGASILPGLIFLMAGAYFMFNGKWIKAVAFPAERHD